MGHLWVVGVVSFASAVSRVVCAREPELPSAPTTSEAGPPSSPGRVDSDLEDDAEGATQPEVPAADSAPPVPPEEAPTGEVESAGPSTYGHSEPAEAGTQRVSPAASAPPAEPQPSPSASATDLGQTPEPEGDDRLGMYVHLGFGTLSISNNPLARDLEDLTGLDSAANMIGPFLFNPLARLGYWELLQLEYQFTWYKIEMGEETVLGFVDTSGPDAGDFVRDFHTRYRVPVFFHKFALKAAPLFAVDGEGGAIFLTGGWAVLKSSRFSGSGPLVGVEGSVVWRCCTMGASFRWIRTSFKNVTLPAIDYSERTGSGTLNTFVFELGYAFGWGT